MLDVIFSWNTLWWILMILYVPSCIGLIAIVLLQKGKGMGFAGAFGAGGGSEAVFGPRTSRSLPQRLTYTMAGMFMVIAIMLSLLAGVTTRGAAPGLISDAEAAEIQQQQMDSLFEEGGEASAVSPEITVDGGATPPVQVESVTLDGQEAPESVTVTPQIDGNVVTIPAAETALEEAAEEATEEMSAAAEEAPAEEAPAEEAPAEEAADEAPAEEAAADEAPAEEEASAEQPQ